MDGAWDSRQVAGRTAGLLMIVSGVASVFSLLRPDAPGESPSGVLAVGIVAALVWGCRLFPAMETLASAAEPAS